MNAPAKVIPLRDRPDLCAFFASEFAREWPSWYGTGGAGDANSDRRSFANAAGNLPVGVVALDGFGKPVGIAALKASSIPSHVHLCPWAAAGFVLPSHRGRGIGTASLSALLDEAARLGFSTVYCATSTSISLLLREGWTHIDTVNRRKEALQVFSRKVGNGIIEQHSEKK